MRRILVVAVVLLAGCSGLVGSGAQPDAPTVTPAPVPTTTKADVVLPRTDDGTPAVGRIIARHQGTLSTRDFHRRSVVDGNLSTTDVWVDREAARIRIRHTAARTHDIVLEGNRRYERSADGAVRSGRPDDATLPYVDSTSGFFLLQRYVSGLVYNRTGTVTRDGTRLAVLRANTTDSTIDRAGYRTVVAADSTLYVDRDGVVRTMDHRERYADGTVRTLRFRVWTGEDSVVTPTWFP